MKFDEKVFTHSTLEEGYDFFITDKWKKRRHFKISTFPCPNGLLSEAIEVVENEKNEPYEFVTLFPFDTDIEYAELQLKAKIKRGINKRYLSKTTPDGSMTLGKKNELVGRIAWNDDPDGPDDTMTLVVDGKIITKDTFWRLLSQYEGWIFKLKIVDRTEE